MQMHDSCRFVLKTVTQSHEKSYRAFIFLKNKNSTVKPCFVCKQCKRVPERHENYHALQYYLQAVYTNEM